MKYPALVVVLLAGWSVAGVARAHIEAQYTLGRVASEATNILIIEVARINKEKNLVICKKVRDLKGEHAGEEIKQNIGQRGEPGDAKAVMDWAEVGRQAVFFYNETGSLTCTGLHWYQAFKEGEWWAMSHAEVYMVRTYFGDVARLIPSVEELIAGKDVVIPCMADGGRETLQKKSGKIHTVKASLKRIDYDPKRDFVAEVGDGASTLAAAKGIETKTFLSAGGGKWKTIAAAGVKLPEKQWRSVDFDDKDWATVKTPAGYGEPEIESRKGTVIKQKGEAMLLRRVVDVPAELLARKELTFVLRVASDDSAAISVNGQLVADEPQEDHDFSYWNQTVSLPGNSFRSGTNVIAVLVRNTPKSSDLYFDLEISAEFKKDK